MACRDARRNRIKALGDGSGARRRDLPAAGCLYGAARNLGYRRRPGADPGRWATPRASTTALWRCAVRHAAYWSGHPRSAPTGQQRARLLADGQGAAQLHLLGGLAAARRGDAAARAAIAAARDAGTASTTTSCSRSAASSAFPGHPVLLRGLRPGRGGRCRGRRRRTGARHQPVRGGPGPGEQHSRGADARAHRLAIARLRAGALDAAIAALEPCWPPRASARRSRASDCPCSGPDCHAGISARPGPAAGRAAARSARGTRTFACSGRVGQARPEGGAMPRQIKDEKTTRRCAARGTARRSRPGSPTRPRELAQAGRPEGREEPVLRRLVQGGPGQAARELGVKGRSP